MYKLDVINRQNPRWRLNHNWEPIFSLATELCPKLVSVSTTDDNPLDEQKVEQAQARINEYQSKFMAEPPRLQPTQSYGRAYLRKGYTVINERYDEEMAANYNWPDFAKHVKAKFNWSTPTFESVNWDTFKHIAKKQNINKRTQLLKYVYEWQPIGKMKKRINQLSSTQCPSCKFSLETPSHMFQCNTGPRTTITTSCLNDIQLICKKWKMHIIITNEIMTTLKAWIEFPVVEPSFDQVSDTESREALEAQSKIGWDKFFKGFIAQPLQHLINAQRNNQLNAFEKIRWTTEVISTIWDHQLQHWKQRNSDDHGATIQESEEIKHQRLLKEAKDLYSQKHLIPPANRAMFPSWKCTRLKTNANLEIWVRNVHQTIQYILDISSLADDDPDTTLPTM